MIKSYKCSLIVGCVMLVGISASGCASGFGSSRTSTKKIEKEHYVSDEDEEAYESNKDEVNWRRQTRDMRGESKAAATPDSWLDKYMWSNESRDIFRSLNVNP